MKIGENGDFLHISGIFGQKKIFLKNRTRQCFEHSKYASLCQKSEKTNDQIPRKCPKSGFSSIFGRKFFFLKIGLRNFLGIAILHLCAKNQKKTNEPIPRKQTNGRTTDKHRLIYRTSEVGPKMQG